MDTKESFRILGIDKTKEEYEIIQAYRNMLINVNPEDDPEGFMRLREAYEAALKYARSSVEEEMVQESVWLEEGIAGTFLKKVMDVYTCLPKRLDAEAWKELLKDPALQSLEDGEEAKWRMFVYLADHYRLPCSIWRVLDELFFIEENQIEFKEHLPENFVDYILYKIHDKEEESDFPFEAFRGASDAEYDEFLEALIEVMNGEEETDEGLKLKRKKEKLDKLASFQIEHPWYELEQAKYLMEAGDREEAEHMMRELLAHYGNDEKIILTAADMMMEKGDGAEVKTLLEEYLNREKSSDNGRYRALYQLGKLAADRKEWREARKYAVDARRVWQTEEVAELIRQADEALVAQYTSAAESLTMEEARVLGWCYYDMQRAEEGIAFFETHPEYTENTTEYHKQMTFLYAGSRQAEAVLKEAGLWRSHMEKEEEKDNSSEFANSYYMEGFAYRVLFSESNENDELAEKYYALAIEAFDRALESKPEYVEFRIEKVSLFKDRQEYQQMIDECQKILAVNNRHFAAYYYMQEAYKELRMAQEVIDTFYRAKEIYAGEPEIYLRALKVFVAYDQYQDALGILHQAEEAGVDGYHPLLVEKINVLDQLAENEEEWKQADDYAEEVIRRLIEEQAESKLLAEAYLNRAYLNENGANRNNDRLEQARKCAELSLEQEDNVNVRYFLGRFYEKYHKDGEKAYPHLKACEEQGMQFEWMYFYIARCHEHFKEWEQAIEYYKKVAEKNPDTKEAYWRIAWLYRAKFNRTEQKEYAELSLKYIEIHEEKHGDAAENHRWRAMTYRRLGNCQRALEEIDKALGMEQDSGMWFLRGQLLRRMRRYDEAIESYQNSIEAEDRYGQDDENSYFNIFQCYLKKGCLDEGIAYLEKVLEKELTKEIKDGRMDDLSDLEGQAGRHKRALYWQEQRFGSVDLGERSCDSWEREAERIEDVLNVWQQFQLNPGMDFEEMLEKAASLTEKAYQDKEGAPEERAHVCQNMGERYYFAGEFEKAFACLEKALQLMNEFEQKEEGNKYEYRKDLWCYLMKASHWIGEKEKNKQYGAMYRKELEKAYEECKDLNKTMEELMTSPGISRNEMYSLFNYAFYTSWYEQAKHYLKLLENRDMCYWCDEMGCTELWEARGFIAFHEEREEEAEEYFEKARTCCWLGGNKEAMMMLRKLRASR